MAELSKGQRVISRALALMQNRGLGWPKAIDIAAQSLEPSPPPKQKAAKP